MESSFFIDIDKRIVHMHSRGELTAAGLTTVMNAIAADARYSRGMHAIGDFRECFGNWDYSETQCLRDYIVRIRSKSQPRWAAVVKPGALVAIGHLVILISEAIGPYIAMRLFEDPQQASRWVQQDS